MTFEKFDQAIAMLQRRGRVSYRALKRQFDLDDSYLADLKAEIIDVHTGRSRPGWHYACLDRRYQAPTPLQTVVQPVARADPRPRALPPGTSMSRKPNAASSP